MTYETFLEWIPDLVQAQLGEGVKVRLHTIYKNNNIRKDALCVLEEGSNVSPTIYLEKYYARWSKSAMRSVESMRSIIAACIWM